MLYNSYVFILIFLPISLLIYFCANKLKSDYLSKGILIALSILFLGYSSWYSVAMLAISAMINYLFNLSIWDTKKKAVVIIGILFNVLYLAGFKFSNYLISDINAILRGQWNALHIILPIGISFYTFQQIAFLVDNYRGEIKRCAPIDYILFTVYFPKLIQGPIVYHNELLEQFSDWTKKRFCPENFCKGLYIFSLGLGKKALLADNFGKIVVFGYSNISSLNAFEALLTILGYTLQLYLDFSGYCDMAIGVSEMLNIDMPVNFNSPYQAKNISDFWKRWHITLTRFLTKYIYIPLGGNRKGQIRTCMNVMLVYLISGIWHGAGYTFIFWGLLHGMATICYRMTKKTFDKLFVPIQWLMTFCFINIAWVFFRASTIKSAWNLLQRLLTGKWLFSINAELTETLLMTTFVNIPSQFLSFPLVIVIFYSLAILGCVFLQNTNAKMAAFRPTVLNGIAVYMLLVLGILSLSGVSTFLYTNF